jgi:hypothetical protein
MLAQSIERKKEREINPKSWLPIIPEKNKFQAMETGLWYSIYKSKKEQTINPSILLDYLEIKRNKKVYFELIKLTNQEENELSQNILVKDKDNISQQIFDVLSDFRWDFWTVEAIAKETGLSLDEVKKTIDSNQENIRKSSVPDRKGRDLYTLSSKPMKIQEYLALLRILLAKSFS